MENLAKTLGELNLYHDFAKHIQQGLFPYRDFPIEYPPLSLVFFQLAQVFGDKWFTLIWYLLVVIFVILIGVVIHKLKGNVYIFLSSILVLGGLFFDRFDIFPAFFSILAVYLLLKKKTVLAALILSLAVGIKIYPIVLLPLFLIEKNVKKLFLSSLVFLIVLIIPFLVVLHGGGREGLLKLADYNINRGMEINSFKSSYHLIKYLMGKEKLMVNYNHSSYEIEVVE